MSLHCGAVTCLLPTRGDCAAQLLFSAGADGAIFALRLDSARFLATLAAPLGATDDALRPPASPTRKEHALLPAAAAPTSAVSEHVFSEVECVPRAALAESEAALAEARARYAALQASSRAALHKAEARARQQAEAQAAEHARQLSAAEQRVAEVQTAREAEVAAAQSRFAELTSAMDEKRRKAVRHLEQCLRKEIERHDGVAAQLAASSADAQMRLAMAGLQVQQALEAQAAQRAEAAAEAGALRAAHEAEVARLRVRVRVRVRVG